MSRKTVMDSNNKQFIAIAVGAGLHLVGFAIQHFYHRHEKEILLREINKLENDVKELRQEITILGQVIRFYNITLWLLGIFTCLVLYCRVHTTHYNNFYSSFHYSFDGSRRSLKKRRVRSLANGYDSETTASMYSAVETDDDDEFYDLSSDEDYRLFEKLRINHNDMDKNKEEEESLLFFAKIDELMKGSIEDKNSSLASLLQCSDKLSSNVDFEWRLAKAYKLQVDFAADAKDKEKQLKFIGLGLKHAQTAIDLDPKNGNAQKWFAIIVGLKSDFLPVKEKIENGALFRKHLSLALEIIPEDHTLHHLLARFKFAVANLSWIEKKAAKMMGDLPDFTMEDAIEDAKVAENLSPEPWIENRLLLAKSFVANGNYKEACDWLEKARPLLTDNQVTKNEVESLYAKYKSYKY